MERYFDLKALPNAEILQSAVITHLMQGLHNLLLNFNGRVGLAFPAYREECTLGGIIRIAGIEEDIKLLHEQIEIIPLFSDYAVVTAIAAIPKLVKGYAKYKRHHVKGNSRLVRHQKRQESKGSWTSELANMASKQFNVPVNFPHVCLSSSSTNQKKFMLFIKKYTQSKPGAGKFNAYGLSLGEATIPIF